MRNIPKGPLGLATLGALPTLALIAAALPSVAQAQIRGRLPTVTTPDRQAPAIRRRAPVQDSNCPDPIQARRDGRSVPAGCPGAQEEQAPVAVQYREQSGETPASTERESRPVAGRRTRPAADTPLVDQPVDDGRARRRIPVVRAPADDVQQDAVPDRPAPVRRRTGDVARTPDDVAPRREITPDRPPPIRRRDDVARTPDEVDPREPTPVRPTPVRRRDDTVAIPEPDVGRTRPFPRRDPPVAAEPVRPVRPFRPANGGDLAGRPDVMAGQVQCVYPRPQTKPTLYDVTVKMLCGFPGPSKAMTFNFSADQWHAVERAYAEGFAVRVTFGTPVNGEYPAIEVVEGVQALAKAVCVPISAGYSSSLSVPSKPSASIRMWCTADGKVVLPLDIGLFENSDYPKLRDRFIEDGPVEISYFHVTTPYTLDTTNLLTPYPEPGTDWINTTATSDRNKVYDQGQYPSGLRLTYAEAPLTGRVLRCAGDEKAIAAGICVGYRWSATGNQGVWTNYRAFASDIVINAASRPAKPGERKSVTYTLMPGIIPPQYRAQAGGACRVILAVEVQIEIISGGVGTGYADGTRPQGNAPGTVTGVAGEPSAPIPPKADDCH